ncbi:hypothetical protein [Citricoccus sp. SGAir0253]|uniref:hypothetical protein n=1 Tax=Citricoccus sp. SGAir0253 TaxID=2567881 RepID=UPI001AEF690A|nr:hypothetical protein [Citricoccus sp. SGAir0253]
MIRPGAPDPPVPLARTAVTRSLLGLAIFQVLSTLLGVATMVLMPQWYTEMLAGTPFEGRVGVAAVLLGVATGGWQWLAILVHWLWPQRLALAHLVAGTVMLGWIAGECLVLDAFSWPHALWGGAGALQVVLVAVHLGALRPQPAPARRGIGRPWHAEGDGGPGPVTSGTHASGPLPTEGPRR